MFEVLQLTFNIQSLHLQLVLKIIILIMILLYFIFSIIVYNNIRALNRIVFFPPRSAGIFLRSIALIYSLLALSLFLITLVIV